MTYVDAMSRAPVSSETDTVEEVIGKSLEVLIVIDDAANTIAMQHTYTKLKEIISILKIQQEDRSLSQKER